MGIFREGEDSRGDHGLGRLVEFKFKAPPGTISPSITTHTPSGQRNCASWASQTQKSVTLLPCSGGRTTKSTKDMWWHWREKKISGVPRNFVRGRVVQQIQLRTEDRENGDLGAVAPLVRVSGGRCNLVQEISFHIVKFS